MTLYRPVVQRIVTGRTWKMYEVRNSCARARSLRRFLFLDCKNLLTLIVTAVWTNTVRHIQIVAIRAFRQILRLEREMAAAAITASFGQFPLWKGGHSTPYIGCAGCTVESVHRTRSRTRRGGLVEQLSQHSETRIELLIPAITVAFIPVLAAIWAQPSAARAANRHHRYCQ